MLNIDKATGREADTVEVLTQMQSRLSRRAFLAGVMAGGVITGLAPQPLLAVEALPVPASPLFEKKLFDCARGELSRHAVDTVSQNRVAIANFSQPSWEARLHILEMDTEEIRSYMVTHGRGSDPQHDGWLDYFSNEPGSLATSQGAYVTGRDYYGEHGLSRRLIGLDPDNSNAEMRAIVIHGAWYAELEIIGKQGVLGRSEGCFAVAESVRDEVVGLLSEGTLFYAGLL